MAGETILVLASCRRRRVGFVVDKEEQILGVGQRCGIDRPAWSWFTDGDARAVRWPVGARSGRAEPMHPHDERSTLMMKRLGWVAPLATMAACATQAGSPESTGDLEPTREVSPESKPVRDGGHGGGNDGATSDTGAVDTGAADTGVDTGTDSGPADTGTADTGASDTGAGDGGLPTLPSPTLPPVSMSNLVFGAWGDVRPANPDDTANFPDKIISAIFAGLQAQGITYTINAGDHCFQTDTNSGAACHDQFVNHFMPDMRANYSGTLIPTMGNHEGCGYFADTTGNCTSWTSGLVHDFLVDVVQPTTGQSAYPYYSVLVHGSWGTAKFIHVAANAWTNAQNTWLTSTLNVPTTYTFGVRHEPASDNRAPGVDPSEALYSSHHSSGTLTLSITGHTHLIQLPGGTQPYGDPYGSTQAYEIILGNAGAPLDAGPYYGFAVMQRRLSDGAIVTQAYKSVASDGVTLLNNVADTSYRFAVNANGSSNSNTSLP
jgi:hypothetical protein